MSDPQERGSSPDAAPRDASDALTELTASRLRLRPGEGSRPRIARFVLEVLTGADAGTRFDSGRPRVVDGRVFAEGSYRFVAGRAPQHDLVLGDASISHTHFDLELAHDHVVLHDLGSRNGTWIGGARLIGAVALSDGAEFEAGRCRMRIRCSEQLAVPVACDAAFGSLRGTSGAMRELFALLARLAPNPITTLLLGETGTGKEEVARSIHEASGRTGPFVVLDCAALPRDLAEAAILGHRKGAFTGAVTDQPGAFEAAQGGTLLIDEVGELPLDLQPKLLRVLERREVQRVGEHHPRAVDVRVLAATHRDLARAIAEGGFRPDLYYRLAQYVVTIPALRERPEDIGLLARHFVARVAHDVGRPLELADDACAYLESLRWEGNVRQLRLAVECAAHLASGARVGRENLVVHDLASRSAQPDVRLREAAAEVMDAYLRQGCERALRASGGKVEQAAHLTGYSARGFRDLLRRLGLRVDET